METLLSSDRCALLFDSLDGSLVILRDLERKVKLVGPPAQGSPPLAVDGLAPSLKGLRLTRSWGGARLSLAFESQGLLFDLGITLGSRSASSTWTLDARNPGAAAREVQLDFPVLHGTGGALFAGSGACPVPWMALADPSRQASLGVVVRRQGEALPGFSAAEGVARARLGSLRVPPGRTVRAAEAMLLAGGPGWRATARACGAWLGRAGTPALPVEPVRDVEHLLALRLSFPAAALAAADPVLASLAGLPCRRGVEAAGLDPLERSWACGCASALPALRAADVLDDPASSDPGVAARMFRGRHMDAVVCARLPEPGEQGSLAGFHAPWEVSVPVRGAGIPEVAVCDLEDHSWTRLEPIVRDGFFRFDSSSNWMLCVVLGSRLGLVGFEQPAITAPGSAAAVRLHHLAGTGGAPRVLLRAPGLRAPAAVPVPSEVRIPVPPETRPGWYPVWVEGRRTPRFVRFLRVLG